MKSTLNWLVARSMFSAAIIVGCGASGTQLEDEPEGDTSLVTQPLSAPTRAGLGYGVLDSRNHAPCSLNNSRQVCLLPTKKVHRWCVVGFQPSVGGGLTAAEN